MVLLTRKIEFSASHLYHNPNLSAQENRRIFGKCNNPHGHGHNYTLQVTIEGEPDPDTGMVLDLKELKEMLEQEIMRRMDHRHLNYEAPELAGQIPTCENIARVIWQLLEPKITQGRLHRVRLYESPDLFAACYRNGANGAGKTCAARSKSSWAAGIASRRRTACILRSSAKRRIAVSLGNATIPMATAIITSWKSAYREKSTRLRA